jgi:hypothetical protein
MRHVIEPFHPLNYRPDGSLDSYNDPADFGLTDSGKQLRRTSLTWCSCRFPTAFGGLPCRHMLYCHVVGQVEKYPIHLVGDKWIRRTVESDEAMHMALHRTEPPRVIPRAPTSNPSSCMTRNERFKMFMAEAKVAAELVCSDHNAFSRALASLESISNLARGHNLRQDEPEEGLPQPTEDALPECNSSNAAIESPTDVASLKSALGIQFQRDTQPTRDECADNTTFLGRFVAVKFNPRRQGGWFVGQVEESITTDNFLNVYYPYDEKTVPHEFKKETNVLVRAFFMTNIHFLLAYMCFDACFAVAHGQGWQLDACQRVTSFDIGTRTSHEDPRARRRTRTSQVTALCT